MAAKKTLKDFYWSMQIRLRELFLGAFLSHIPTERGGWYSLDDFRHYAETGSNFITVIQNYLSKKGLSFTNEELNSFWEWFKEVQAPKGGKAKKGGAEELEKKIMALKKPPIAQHTGDLIKWITEAMYGGSTIGSIIEAFKKWYEKTKRGGGGGGGGGKTKGSGGASAKADAESKSTSKIGDIDAKGGSGGKIIFSPIFNFGQSGPAPNPPNQPLTPEPAPAQQPLMVNILHPSEGTTFKNNDKIDCLVDIKGGVPPYTLEWVLDYRRVFGHNALRASFVCNLVTGSHSIEVFVTDSAKNTASDGRNIIVDTANIKIISPTLNANVCMDSDIPLAAEQIGPSPLQDWVWFKGAAALGHGERTMIHVSQPAFNFGPNVIVVQAKDSANNFVSSVVTVNVIQCSPPHTPNPPHPPPDPPHIPDPTPIPIEEAKFEVQWWIFYDKAEKRKVEREHRLPVKDDTKAKKVWPIEENWIEKRSINEPFYTDMDKKLFLNALYIGLGASILNANWWQWDFKSLEGLGVEETENMIRNSIKDGENIYNKIQDKLSSFKHWFGGSNKDLLGWINDDEVYEEIKRYYRSKVTPDEWKKLEEWKKMLEKVQRKGWLARKHIWSRHIF